jgi:CubicO group peptidase (beta-lactamase class C family)
MFALFAAALLLASAATDAADLRAKTDALFAEWNRTDSPGCALAIYHDGVIAYERGYGMASLELSVPITPQTVFDIGSTSKQFTAACIGLLAQDGKLALDDDIRKYLPELPRGEKPITIRHLLNHASGLRDYIEVMSLAGFREQDRTTAAETLTAITRQKTQNFPPGEKHLYSNTGFFLLAQIVERVSKKSLREFAHERIFAPLAMRHTEILDDCTHIVRNKANSYGPDEAGFIALTSDWEQTGDGAVQTTVEDLQLWDENFYSGKVGGTALREMLLTRGKLNDGTVLDYCSGLMTGKVRGLDIVKHGGAWVGFRAELVRFPSQHFSVVCLCNLAAMDASGLAQKVAELWLDAEMSHDKTPVAATEPDTRPAVEVAPAELAPFVGQYRHDDLMVAITLEGGALAVSGPSVRAGRLTPLGKYRFRRERAPRALDVVFENGAMRFEFKDGTRWDFTPVVPWTPAADELARFAGKYWSDEIGAALEIQLVEGALTVVGHRTLSPLRLEPLTRDAFTSDLGRLTFQTEKNAVSGFVVDGGRAKGLRYVRQ